MWVKPELNKNWVECELNAVFFYKFDRKTLNMKVKVSIEKTN